jgi:hypothetical protein
MSAGNELEIVIICKTIVRDRKAGPLTVDMLSDALERYRHNREHAMQERIAAAMKETTS